MAPGSVLFFALIRQLESTQRPFWSAASEIQRLLALFNNEREFAIIARSSCPRAFRVSRDVYDWEVLAGSLTARIILGGVDVLSISRIIS